MYGSDPISFRPRQKFSKRNTLYLRVPMAYEPHADIEFSAIIPVNCILPSPLALLSVLPCLLASLLASYPSRCLCACLPCWCLLACLPTPARRIYENIQTQNMNDDSSLAKKRLRPHEVHSGECLLDLACSAPLPAIHADQSCSQVV